MKRAALWTAFGVAWMCCGTARLHARDASAVKDPISPEECRKDKRKAADCQRLGMLYAAGEQVPVDAVKAVAYLEPACRAELPDACLQLGWMLVRHHAQPGDAERGAQMLEKLCKQDDARACAGLGAAYASGTGVARNVSTAVELLDKGCELRAPLACLSLADLLDAGEGVATDRERSMALRARACKLGDTTACRTACERGSGESCPLFAALATRDKSIDQAAVEATYRKACDAGAAAGCHQLAWMTKDEAQAVVLWEGACAQGHAPSCVDAAAAHYLGVGGAQDLDAAARLYAAACEKSDAFACRMLGGIYARGELGAEQVESGRAYLAKACRGDVQCLAIVANGRVPEAWGGSLEALRPRKRAGGDAGPVRVGGTIQEPRKIRNVPPRYPMDARKARIQGTVVLECTISPHGYVTDVRVVRTIPLLERAAIEAVRQWRYTPTLLNGQAVPVIMTVTVSFTIS